MSELVQPRATLTIDEIGRRLFEQILKLEPDTKSGDLLYRIHSICSSHKQWEALLSSLPIDGLSFRVQTGVRRTDAISILEEWCKYFAQKNKGNNNYIESQNVTFGHLAILLITLITMEELALSTMPISSDLEDHNDPATTSDSNNAIPNHNREKCSNVCGVLIRDKTVQTVLLALYAPTIGPLPAGESPHDAPESESLHDAPRDSSDLDPIEEWKKRIEPSSLEFHRHGSTSFILSGVSVESRGQEKKFALKCVLFPYSSIPIIASKTASYKKDHNAAPSATISHMVRVWASTAQWILMDFADGVTLAEEIKRLKDAEQNGQRFCVKGSALVPCRHGRRLNKTVSAAGSVRLDLIRRLGLPLLDALKDLQLQGKKHEDLSPSNVIVRKTQKEGEEKYEITFIDFGQNYLYTRSIGELEGPDAVFVAPEVRNNENNTNKTDLYSFGRILIALGDVGVNKDGTIPDRFYGQTPLIARLIEDLIDNKPERRLLVFEMTTTPSASNRPVPKARRPAAVGDSKNTFTYAALSIALKQELDVTQAALVIEPEQLRNHAVPYDRESLASLVAMLYPFSREPRKRWRVYKIRRDQNIPNPRRSMYAGWLFAFSVAASINFWITGSVSVFWFLRDLGIDILNPGSQLTFRILGWNPNTIPVIDDLRQPDYQLGQVVENLPARIIGLSFALCAYRYYENILGGITTRVVQSSTLKRASSGLGTELTIRTMSIWSSWLILSANLVQVRWWPLCSAIGYTGSLLANVSSVRFATKYLDMARQRGLSTVPPAHQEVTGLASFRQWGQSMFFYSLIVWAIAIPIYLGVLKDVYIYAILVASINIGMFYIIKTGLNALDIRTGLNRGFLAAERLRYAEERQNS